jgi:hypothetical protein
MTGPLREALREKFAAKGVQWAVDVDALSLS